MSMQVLLAEAEAVSVERISPTFVRVVLGAPELADFGVDGPLYDQRIKLVLPHGDGPLPSVAGADESWLTTWRERTVEERGHMRTYSVRDVLGSGAGTRLVVDFVVHEDGLAGPGAGWALAAKPGDRVVLLAPRRGVPFGGIEFVPGAATSILLVADESAVPAAASILEGLPPDTVGSAYLEVPDARDVQHVRAPAGVDLHWYARGEGEPGCRLVPTVREYAGLSPSEPDAVVEVDPDLWETPTWSSSGESLEERRMLGHDLDGVFAWIAGEAAMVTRLRRALVREVGVDRRQVAFMGYWRRGVAMQS
jgi:NADPH-dependent ferric siderophore reductase